MGQLLVRQRSVSLYTMTPFNIKLVLVSFGDCHWPVVYIAYGVLDSCRKTIILLQSFPSYSHLSVVQAHLMEYDHSLFGSNWSW